MNRRVLAICGGVVLLVLGSSVPYFVESSGPADTQRLSAHLLAIRGAHEALEKSVLQLRLGLIPSYDPLVAGQADLERTTGELLADLEALPPGARARIGAAFATYREALARQAEFLVSFPTANATLNNSLRLLCATHERARVRGGESPPEAPLPPAELDALYARTLKEYALPSTSPAVDLLADLDRASAAAGGEELGVARAMLSHARIVTAQQDDVDLILHELTGSGALEDLDATFRVVASEGQRISAERARRSRVLYATGVLVAVLVCATICTSVLRQNRALEREAAERIKAHEEARRYELELRQAQKLEAVGQLAAGIAHEINTPTQFVNDNTRFVRESIDSVVGLLKLCDRRADGGASADGGALPDEIEALVRELDLSFLIEELPAALDESLGGLERIAGIVQAMKSFSHPGSGSKEAVDLNEAVRTTITVSRGEWKNSAEVVADLDPDLPAVPGLRNELNQVVLNLIVNAADAIEEHAPAGGKGTIRISTRRDGDSVELRVKDDGPGMPEEVRERVFDPFFTTKEVGKGTGQGLAIARCVIVDKHGGTIDVQSAPGEGAEFVIRLPLSPFRGRDDAAAGSPRPAAGVAA